MATKKSVAKKTVKNKAAAKPKKAAEAIGLNDYLEHVRKRAYEIFNSRGAIHGSDLDDWINAEKQIKKQYGLK